MESKKVLVTGSSGFVGANLVRRLLKENFEVHVVLREQSNTWRLNEVMQDLNVVRDDLLNFEKLNSKVNEIKPEVVFHLATFGGHGFQKDFDLIFQSNVVGTFNLAKACLNVGVSRFINTGSSSEYGLKEKPMKETDVLEPNSLYCVSKAFASNLFSFLSENGLPSTTLRLFSPFGPFDEKTRLVSFVIFSCLENKNLKLFSPNLVRDYVFIDDVIDAYLKALNSEKAIGEIINVGSGKQTLIKELMEKVIELTDSSSIIESASPVPGAVHGAKMESKVWVADVSKARKLLNWQSETSLNDGLKKSIEWFKNNLELYK
ncbi:MAG: NAD-dependent epimerase/dehydratase family protein [archaeon]